MRKASRRGFLLLRGLGVGAAEGAPEGIRTPNLLLDEQTSAALLSLLVPAVCAAEGTTGPSGVSEPARLSRADSCG